MGFCSNPGKHDSVSSQLKDSPTASLTYFFEPRVTKCPSKTSFESANTASIKADFSFCHHCQYLAEYNWCFTSGHSSPTIPWGHFGYCSDKKSWLHQQIKKQNQKSTQNILTYADILFCAMPPTVPSTNKDVSGINISHVTWTTDVFHFWTIGKWGNALVFLFEFCGWETWRSIAGTYQQKLHQKDAGRKSSGCSGLIYSEGPGEDTSVALKLLKARSKEDKHSLLWGMAEAGRDRGGTSPTPGGPLPLTPYPAVSEAGHKVQVNRFLSPTSINHCTFFSWNNFTSVLHRKGKKGKGRWILITKIYNVLKTQRLRGKEKDPTLVNPRRRFSFEGS